MALQTVDPTTNKLIKSFPEMTDGEVETSVAHAHKAYAGWRKTAFTERAALLHKVASLMREQKTKLATLITLEMGKLIGQAEGEIVLSADIIDYYASNGAAFLADKPLDPQFGKAFIRFSPIGVLLGVEPWNFPFLPGGPLCRTKHYGR